MTATRAERELAGVVAESLTATGRGELLPLLERLAGRELPGGWVLGEPIGVGARGLVLAARGPAGEVAVKLPLLDHHRPWIFGTAEIEAARAHLAREAATLERLAPELPALPRYHALIWAPSPLHAGAREVEAIGDDPFLVMERVRGPSLIQALARADEVDRAEAMARTVRALLGALSTLATLGGIYTDLKPEHLVIDSSGPRLLDAGSIWLPGHPSLALTPAYAAAESGINAARASRRSLAATLYEAWTGRSPSTRATDPEEWKAAPRWLRALVSALEVEGTTWSDLLPLVPDPEST